MMKIRSRIRAAICIGLLYLAGGSIANAGTIMPPGEITFFDNNGVVLSAGCVYFYIPGTTSPKATYQNAAQTVANTNPVLLDSAGRAIIYGTGTYRQIVQQAPCPGGTQIWDQITASTDSSATIFAGASAGTPNAITVTAPAFAGIDGQVINYISTSTNSGGATFNPSGFGAVQIVRDSATGPGALTGGELVATNAVSLMYDATAGTFHILSPVTWPNTSGVPVGSVLAVGGFTAPTNYAFAYGQAVSRTTFSSLFGAYTFAQSGSISSGSPTITGLTDTTQFGAGMPVESLGIPAATTLLSCTSTTCTMSANASTTRTGAMTVFAYGNGDGTNTFNLPDYRGVGLAGRDNMGGPARGNLTATYFGPIPTVLGTQSTVGQSITLLATNLPSVTSTNAAQAISVTTGLHIPVSSLNWSGTTISTAGATTIAFTGGSVGDLQTIGPTNNSISVTSTGTSSTPFSKIPPTAIVNYAVRLTP